MFRFRYAFVLLLCILSLTACVPRQDANFDGSTQLYQNESSEQRNSQNEGSLSSQENSQSDIDNEQNASVTVLSQEELQFFENLFVSEYGRVFTTMLLSSEYDAPENIHLGWLFREGVPNEDGSWGYDISAEEMSALQDVMDEESYAFFLNADSYKIPRAVMENLLMTWLGISLGETELIGMDFFTYLEEYDAYYSAASDTASVVPGFSSGIRKENGLIELRYHQKIVYGGEDHSGPDTHILTLCPVGNSYQFISNLRIED